jgi:hypothetical protein
VEKEGMMKSLIQKYAVPVILGLVIVIVVLLLRCCQGGRAVPFAMDTTGAVTLARGTFDMDSTGVVRPGECDLRREVGAIDPAHMDTTTDAALITALRQNGFCQWFIPEWDDEQAFRTDQEPYGPVVRVFSSPWSMNYTKASDFASAFLLVAIINVEAAPGSNLPEPYQRLRLHAGRNCLFLHWDSASPHPWQAAVKDDNAKTCATSTDTARRVDVAAAQTPGAQARDYTPAARFIEGPSLDTYIGVRCGDALCVVGTVNLGGIPGTPAAANQAGTGQGVGPTVEWRRMGWNDEQHLGVMEQNGAVMRPMQEARVVPDIDLGKWTLENYKQDRPHVATVWIPAGTPALGKYATLAGNGFCFKPGKNEVWMSAEDAVESGETVTRWTMWIGTNPNDATSHPVTRVDHSGAGYPIPATARWRWKADDEQLWVECLAGCCRAGPD